MDDKVYSIDASKTAMEALRTMLEKGVWSLVIEKQGLPVGVVTERDIIRRCIVKGRDMAKVKVEEIESSPLITVAPDAPIGQAMTLMAEKGIRRVYVVEGGKIMGRVTQTGAFQHMLNVVMALSQLPYQL